MPNKILLLIVLVLLFLPNPAISKESLTKLGFSQGLSVYKNRYGNFVYKGIGFKKMAIIKYANRKEFEEELAFRSRCNGCREVKRFDGKSIMASSLKYKNTEDLLLIGWKKHNLYFGLYSDPGLSKKVPGVKGIAIDFALRHLHYNSYKLRTGDFRIYTRGERVNMDWPGKVTSYFQRNLSYMFPGLENYAKNRKAKLPKIRLTDDLEWLEIGYLYDKVKGIYHESDNTMYFPCSLNIAEMDVACHLMTSLRHEGWHFYFSLLDNIFIEKLVSSIPHDIPYKLLDAKYRVIELESGAARNMDNLELNSFFNSYRWKKVMLNERIAHSLAGNSYLNSDNPQKKTCNIIIHPLDHTAGRGTHADTWNKELYQLLLTKVRPWKTSVRSKRTEQSMIREMEEYKKTIHHVKRKRSKKSWYNLPWRAMFIEDKPVSLIKGSQLLKRGTIKKLSNYRYCGKNKLTLFFVIKNPKSNTSRYSNMIIFGRLYEKAEKDPKKYIEEFTGAVRNNIVLFPGEEMYIKLNLNLARNKYNNCRDVFSKYLFRWGMYAMLEPAE